MKNPELEAANENAIANGWDGCDEIMIFPRIEAQGIEGKHVELVLADKNGSLLLIDGEMFGCRMVNGEMKITKL